jgi:hypothetical protein
MEREASGMNLALYTYIGDSVTERVSGRAGASEAMYPAY